MTPYKQVYSQQQQYETIKNDMQATSHQLIIFKERCEQQQKNLKEMIIDITGKDK